MEKNIKQKKMTRILYSLSLIVILFFFGCNTSNDINITPKNNLKNLLECYIADLELNHDYFNPEQFFFYVYLKKETQSNRLLIRPSLQTLNKSNQQFLGYSNYRGYDIFYFGDENNILIDIKSGVNFKKYRKGIESQPEDFYNMYIILNYNSQGEFIHDKYTIFYDKYYDCIKETESGTLEVALRDELYFIDKQGNKIQ